MTDEEDSFDENEEEKEETKRLEKESEERDREVEEHQRELERDQRRMEKEERQRERELERHEREMEQNEREMEREREEMEHERRRMERQFRHRNGILPPMPPIPPIPPIPHFKHFDEARLEEEEYFRNRRRKNISIRGLDPELYDKFSTKVQSWNLNLGLVFSKMLVAAITKFNGEFPSLSAKDIVPPKRLLPLEVRLKPEINISKHDLNQAEVRVTLTQIKRVKIEQDVTDEMLKRYVDSINECELVLIPKTIPKLVALSLLNKCQKYEFY